jgi:hypothetical protein
MMCLARYIHCASAVLAVFGWKSWIDIHRLSAGILKSRASGKQGES